MYAKKTLTSMAVASLAALFAASAPAQSADVYKAPAATNDYQQPALSWTGFWVGAAGGGVFGYSDVEHREYSSVDNLEDGIVDNSASVSGLGTQGLIGEGQVGYDKQVSQRLVLGIYGGVNISDTEFSATFDEQHGQDGDDLAVSFDTEWGGVAGLRLGFLKSPDTMFYVGGGYAYTQVGDIAVEIDGGTHSLSGPELDGWFGEVGMETRLPEVGDNVFLTVSGRYTDYGSEKFSVQNPGADDIHTIEVDPDSLAAMVGLKVKLGGN